MSELSSEDKERLQNARVAALVRKYTAGRRLTDAELLEIEPFIPKRVLKKTAKKLRGRDIYERPREFYAGLYGMTTRGLNKWIEAGLAMKPEPMPPPLDDPEKMPAWWGQVMSQRVPEKIYDAIRKARNDAVPATVPHGATPEIEASAAPTPHRATGEPPPPSEPPAELELGFLASLLRTRRGEAEAHQEYEAARKEEPIDEGKVRVKHKIWQDLAEHLRALEKAAPDVLKKSGDMWLAVDIRAELGSLLGPVVNGTRALGRRFFNRLDIPYDVATERAWQDEVDRLFSRLIESRFVSHD